MNLVGYGRVSSESQRDNTSLAMQKDSIKDYCERFGHTLIAYYEEVESGTSIDNRESLQWALKTVAAAADGLIVYRQDRLTRSVLDSERLKMTLLKQGKALMAVAENVDLESDDGEFIFTISSAVAQLERKRISSRAHAGRKKKKELGGYYGGTPPFGYAVFKGTLIEYPAEQKIIRLIKNMFFQDCALMSAIVRHLNDKGYKTKWGRNWHVNQVRRILFSEPEVVTRLRENGKLLTSDHWEEIYGSNNSKLPEAECSSPPGH